MLKTFLTLSLSIFISYTQSTLHLKNGDVITGKIKRTVKNTITISTEFGRLEVKRKLVTKISSSSADPAVYLKARASGIKGLLFQQDVGFGKKIFTPGGSIISYMPVIKKQYLPSLFSEYGILKMKFYASKEIISVTNQSEKKYYEDLEKKLFLENGYGVGGYYFAKDNDYNLIKYQAWYNIQKNRKRTRIYFGTGIPSLAVGSLIFVPSKSFNLVSSALSQLFLYGFATTIAGFVRLGKLKNSEKYAARISNNSYEE